MRRITALFVVGLLLAPEAALGARYCLKGTVFHGTERVSGARLKLTSAQVEVSTFARENGAYAVCAEEGRYMLEVYWGRDLFTDSAFVISANEVRDIHLERLRKQ